VEVMAEEYDFVCYAKDLEDEKIKMFIDVLKSENFKQELNKLDCYDTTESGEINYV